MSEDDLWRPRRLDARGRLTGGRINGSLDCIGPAFVITEVEWISLFVPHNPRLTPDGVFTFGPRYGAKRATAAQGLILPLSACTNAALVRATQSILDALPEAGGTIGYDEFDRFSALLAAIGLEWKPDILDFEGGRVCLEATDHLFAILSDGFHYAVALEDRGGSAVVLETQPFAWPQVQTFVTRHPVHGVKPIPYLCCTGLAFPGKWSLAHPPTAVSRPAPWADRLDDSNEEVALSSLIVRITADYSGWAELALTADGQQVDILLSYAYPPLEDLAEWVVRLARGDLPIRIEINEERRIVSLTAHAIGVNDQIRLVIADVTEPTILFRGACAGRAFVSSMAQAMLASLSDAAQTDGWDQFFEVAEWDDELDTRPFLRNLMRSVL